MQRQRREKEEKEEEDRGKRSTRLDSRENGEKRKRRGLSWEDAEKEMQTNARCRGRRSRGTSGLLLMGYYIASDTIITHKFCQGGCADVHQTVNG